MKKSICIVKFLFVFFVLSCLLISGSTDDPDRDIETDNNSNSLQIFSGRQSNISTNSSSMRTLLPKPLPLTWANGYIPNNVNTTYLTSTNSATRLRNGNIAIIGQIQTSFPPLNDTWLIILDPRSGAILQHTTLIHTSRSLITTHIAETNDGGLIAAGSFMSGLNLGTQILIRLDPSLNVVWARSYGTSYFFSFSRINSVIQTTDGGFISVGSSTLISGNIVTKYDGSGNVIWCFKPDSTALLDVRESSDGYILAGSYVISLYTRQMCILNIDFTGQIRWMKTYLSIQQEQNAVLFSILITPLGLLSLGSGTNGIYILSTDFYGNIYPNDPIYWLVNFPALYVHSFSKTIDVSPNLEYFVSAKDALTSTYWVAKLSIVQSGRPQDIIFQKVLVTTGAVSYVNAITSNSSGGATIIGSSQVLNQSRLENCIWAADTDNTGTVQFNSNSIHSLAQGNKTANLIPTMPADITTSLTPIILSESYENVYTGSIQYLIIQEAP
ncbi:MAG: hypothetical protein HY606_12045 [Planctomycetes bacterium]|nr:hypothetical protein [Planctomycetota bacterium]